MQVAESILELAENPDLRNELGQAARRTVETRHTWEHNAQEVIDTDWIGSFGKRFQKTFGCIGPERKSLHGRPCE